MDKQQILNEIRRIALASGGKAPGIQRFQSETGVSKSDWYPRHWLRWSDAVLEAGLQPNSLSIAFPREVLIQKYIDLMREIGRFPIEGDLFRRHEDDRSFPARDAFSSLGSKTQRAAAIRDHCHLYSLEDRDVLIALCDGVQERPFRDSEEPSFDDHVVGFVYLVRHGSRHEYKIGRTTNPVRREGEIRLQLPEKLQPIHSIKTDDPAGVELYWHSRFGSKRKEGEWFSLTPQDVRAFKRWKKIY